MERDRGGEREPERERDSLRFDDVALRFGAEPVPASAASAMLTWCYTLDGTTTLWGMKNIRFDVRIVLVPARCSSTAAARYPYRGWLWAQFGRDGGIGRQWGANAT